MAVKSLSLTCSCWLLYFSDPLGATIYGVEGKILGLKSPDSWKMHYLNLFKNDSRIKTQSKVEFLWLGTRHEKELANIPEGWKKVVVFFVSSGNRSCNNLIICEFGKC